MGWLELVTTQRVKLNAPSEPWFLAIDHWLNREAIRACEADLTPAELGSFRTLLHSCPHCDAYNVILQNRAYEASGGHERARAEVQAVLDNVMDRALVHRQREIFG